MAQKPKKEPIREKAAKRLKKIVEEDAAKVEAGKAGSKKTEEDRVKNQGKRYQKMYEDETINTLAARPQRGKF